jgi:hypothetical protein
VHLNTGLLFQKSQPAMKRKLSDSKQNPGIPSVKKFFSAAGSDASSTEQKKKSAGMDVKDDKQPATTRPPRKRPRKPPNYVPTGTEADRSFIVPAEDTELLKCIYKVEEPPNRRGLYCETCQAADKGGKWDKEPYISVRLEHAKKHVRGPEHQTSVAALGGQTKLVQGDALLEREEKVFSAWIAKFECAYWLAREEVCAPLLSLFIPDCAGGQRKIQLTAELCGASGMQDPGPVPEGQRAVHLA